MLRSVWMRRARGVLAAVALTTCAACSADSASGAPPAQAATATTLAPYVDMSLSTVPVDVMADRTGVSDVVLAFGLATGDRCEPSWGGVHSLDDPATAARVAAVRARGGRVAVATGGATGPYLENVCGSAAELATAYTRLLDATGATGLDVDLEADVPTDRVVEALMTVQRDRDVDVSLTLPVAGPDTGLPADALDVVRAAAAGGLRFTVDAMVMNFPYRGSWQQAMLQAVDAVAGQLRTVWPDASDRDVASRLGLTVMIGRNDTGPLTTLDDARVLATEARTRGFADVRFWSLTRDNGDCADAATPRPDCSGIAQDPFAFTTTFRDAVRDPGTATTSTNGRIGS